LAPYPDRTLLDYIAESTRERPDHPAFLFKGRAFTLSELERSSDAFAVALAAMGVGRGDRVGIMLPNCPQFFIAELAAWKLGAVVAPFNPIYTTEELEGPLKTSGATVVVALTPFYERLKAVQHHTAVRRIVTTNIKEYFPATVRLLFTLFVERKGGHRITRRDGDLGLDALLREHNGQRPTAAPPKPSDTALFLMSGGTTGTPKCVVGIHREPSGGVGTESARHRRHSKNIEEGSAERFCRGADIIQCDAQPSGDQEPENRLIDRHALDVWCGTIDGRDEAAV